MKGNKQTNAIKYLNPAKVRGGISINPHLIIINEVDHKNVTNKASRMAFKFGEKKLFIWFNVSAFIKLICI